LTQTNTKKGLIEKKAHHIMIFATLLRLCYIGSFGLLEPLPCSRVWDSWCGIDSSVHGVSKFLRTHFLRAYYNNRAPVLLHFNADWLKTFETVTDIEILPNLGYENARKRKVEHRRKGISFFKCFSSLLMNLMNF